MAPKRSSAHHRWIGERRSSVRANASHQLSCGRASDRVPRRPAATCRVLPLRLGSGPRWNTRMPFAPFDLRTRPVGRNGYDACVSMRSTDPAVCLDATIDGDDMPVIGRVVGRLDQPSERRAGRNGLGNEASARRGRNHAARRLRRENPWIGASTTPAAVRPTNRAVLALAGRCAARFVRGRLARSRAPAVERRDGRRTDTSILDEPSSRVQ